jgi:hypothetical protein
MAIERRNQPRTNLRVPLYLLRMEDTIPIRTETEDLSLEGFYCYTERFFSPGEHCQFLMLLPPATKGSLGLGGLCLHGSMQVVRQTTTSDMRYGLGCKLVSYRVLSNSEFLTPEGIVSTLFGNEREECRSACVMPHVPSNLEISLTPLSNAIGHPLLGALSMR